MEFGVNKQLTIVVPTFNRQQPLLRQLKSIEQQGQFDKYNVVISDNHSNYNVKEWLQSQLTPEFLDIIEIHERPYNVGGDLNVSLLFQYPKTEWMWLISDDDITEPDSIATILSDLEEHAHDDVCWIKYSISGDYKPNKECTLADLEDVFDYYSKNKDNGGELFFVSNNVYRLSVLNKYFTDVCIFSDTCMSQALLPMFAIKHDGKEVYFSPKLVTNHTSGKATYSVIWAYLRFGNLLSITTLPLNKREIKAFKRIRFWYDRGLVNTLAHIEDRNRRNEYFKKLFFSNYILFSKRAFICVFYYSLMSLVGSKMWLKVLNKRHGE